MYSEDGVTEKYSRGGRNWEITYHWKYFYGFESGLQFVIRNQEFRGDDGWGAEGR